MSKTEQSRDRGKLVIISGPSGVGKSTIVKQLLEQCELPLELSVSATTRPPRSDDRAGVNYHFMTAEEFQSRVANEEFLEYVEVFGHGYWYGTLKEQVSTGLNRGKWIILEIDIVGAAKVLEVHPEALTIFIHPGNLSELQRRLEKRGTETPESMARRLEVAQQELAAASNYQNIITNKTVDQTVTSICQLLLNSRNHPSGDNTECTTN
ncbi:MAG: guanylate kinase [Mariniblastus sp.]|nr:guanylate kinase [Mariniblastus sp.]